METKKNTTELTARESDLLDSVLSTVGSVLYGPDSYVDFDSYLESVERYVRREKAAYQDDFDAFLSRLHMDLAVVRHAGEYRSKAIREERLLAEDLAERRELMKKREQDKATNGTQADHSNTLAGAGDKFDDCPATPYECDYGCYYD